MRKEKVGIDIGKDRKPRVGIGELAHQSPDKVAQEYHLYTFNCVAFARLMLDDMMNESVRGLMNSINNGIGGKPTYQEP